MEVSNPEIFVFVSSFDIEKLAIYEAAMARLYAEEWSKNLHEKWIVLCKMTLGSLSELKVWKLDTLFFTANGYSG